MMENRNGYYVPCHHEPSTPDDWDIMAEVAEMDMSRNRSISTLSLQSRDGAFRLVETSHDSGEKVRTSLSELDAVRLWLEFSDAIPDQMQSVLRKLADKRVSIPTEHPSVMEALAVLSLPQREIFRRLLTIRDRKLHWYHEDLGDGGSLNDLEVWTGQRPPPEATVAGRLFKIRDKVRRFGFWFTPTRHGTFVWVTRADELST